MNKIYSCYHNLLINSSRASLSLLLIRLVAGAAFILHGWGKIQTPFGWMGPDAAVPGFLQGLAALAEFGGGISWILGLFTPLSALGLMVTMAVAAFVHISGGDPFVGPAMAYEHALVYLTIAICLLLVGPGRYSLDAKLFFRR